MSIQKINRNFPKYQYFQVINLIVVAVTKKNRAEKYIDFSGNIPKRIKMYDFSKALKNGKAKHLSFSELHQNSYGSIWI